MGRRLLLLCACLCAAGTGSRGPRGGAGPSPGLLGGERHGRPPEQLAVVRALSRKYWKLLACTVWQEDCEQEQDQEWEEMEVMQEEEEEEEERGASKVALDQPAVLGSRPDVRFVVPLQRFPDSFRYVLVPIVESHSAVVLSNSSPWSSPDVLHHRSHHSQPTWLLMERLVEYLKGKDAGQGDRLWRKAGTRMSCQRHPKAEHVMPWRESKWVPPFDTRSTTEGGGWSLPDIGKMVSNWYCSFGRCCATGDCRVSNNITGLEMDLSRRLHGQHLAKEVVLKAIQGFLETPQPEKALVLSFHGWSGTGKNFVARIIAENLYQDGLKSECVRVFISLFHFPHSKYVDIYKVQLAKQISETVQLCEQALFLFDEAEKLHSGILDGLKPYMDHYDRIDTVDYRRSIFLFLSNTGGNIINEVALDVWRAGQAREEITMKFLEQRLRTGLLEAREDGYAHNHLLEENLIDFLVPFLPLEYRHVKLCAQDAFLARGLPFTEDTLDEVARMMVFVPKEEKLFSAQGCKSVSQRINFFLP
ncbi:Torsin-3A [Varanus komodoensis]|nr:Torsin-3A [Varanus komodoensis]